MQNKKVKLIFLILVLLVSCGCNIISYKNIDKDEKGYFRAHYNSCGPEALDKAMFEMNQSSNTREISRSIQDGGNNLRFFLALCHPELIEITLPHEMQKVTARYGFQTKTTKSLENLKETDIALILVSNKTYTKCHWLCFPVDQNIKTFFGEGTRIHKIFLLKKVD